MKGKSICLVLFALLVFALAGAEEQEAFSIDEKCVLQGMKRSYFQGYEPAVNQNVMSFILPIQSESAVGSVEAEIILEDESISPFKLQNMKVKAYAAGGVWGARFSLSLHEDRRNGDYACVIRITGKDKENRALESRIPYIFRIRDGRETDEVIRFRVEQVEADFKVGEGGTLCMTLTNPSKTVPFESPVLTIAEKSGDIIPEKSAMVYLDDLAPGECARIEFPMLVLPTASVSPHIMNLSLTWTALGQAYSQTENYTLPVVQEIRLEHGGLRMADSAVAGDVVTAVLPVMNRGKANLIDVMVTISLEGIVERQSVLVGTIAPGETRNAQLSIMPGKNVQGEFSGKIIVSAADNDGNPAEISLPVFLSVEKPVPMESISVQENAERKTDTKTWALFGACGCLTAAFFIQGAYLKKRYANWKRTDFKMVCLRNRQKGKTYGSNRAVS